MAKDDHDFGSRAKKVTDKVPAVYLFQPAYTVVIENHELEQWQKTLAEKVGFSPEKAGTMMPRQGSYSLCGSTYFSEACDCDEI
jgi:hypothetical protein